MQKHFKCFSVKILDYYNITVHLLVCNKLSESIMHGTTTKIKKIPCILWNPKVQYRIHNSPSPVPILIQVDPVHNPTPNLWKIYLNIILPFTLGSPKWSFSFPTPQQNSVCILLSHVRATCPAHLILFDLITRIMLVSDIIHKKNSRMALRKVYHIIDQYLLTYLLTPCSKVLLEKLTGSQLVKKFFAFYGTRRFITAFTSARHLSLS